ncbi:uncharacterized protein PG998_001250 [Apiospora kogelbergensis]|uniref:uncharacterized protein n=1 Tax=Apiospora kogelbergensis TaxID=1337665 RepID=UPI00312FD750
MEAPSFCASIRKRPDWAPVVRALLQSSTPRWKEKLLQSHDVAMPFPPMNGGPKPPVLRAILLCPHDVGTVSTRQRIERLYHLDGGQHMAIVLFMKESRSGCASASLMELQLDLIKGREMPIITISSLDAMPTTLSAFHRQLFTAGGGKKAPPALSLLPYCSGGERLSEHTVNILGEITTGMKDLSAKATSAQGQQQLVEYLDAEAEQAINFWKGEFIVN